MLSKGRCSPTCAMILAASSLPSDVRSSASLTIRAWKSSWESASALLARMVQMSSPRISFSWAATPSSSESSCDLRRSR